MARKNRGANRPSHYCSRGPYRRKREHVEDLTRWDCRDYIDQALPDVDDACEDDYYDFDDEDRDDMPVLTGYAMVDPRDPQYSVFTIQLEVKPGYVQSLQLFRGSRFPNTPIKQTNYWWFWICPECDRRCRYLHTLPGSSAITCRKCWRVVYCSQNKSATQRKNDYWEKTKHLYRNYHSDGYGGWYESHGGLPRCVTPPTPPAGWVPDDLLKRFRDEQARRDLTENSNGAQR